MTKRMTIAAMIVWCLLLASSAVAQPPSPPAEAGPLADHYLDARAGLTLTDALAQALEDGTEPPRVTGRGRRGTRPARASHASAQSDALAGTPR